jgi:hypothetical protein
MMSEHFAAHNFFKDSPASAERVLKLILQLVAKDEVGIADPPTIFCNWN